ncbi:MAG: DUF3662 and FHA domain-containing protein [Nitriliruptorales bacterium]|nr:DUF3662 and FHA domain-containing protein [Nitriliruptorales bacterium]
MGVLQDFERRLEGAVEGFFARAFRSGLQPVELAKAVRRYAEDHQHVTDHGVVIPNVYRFVVNPKDADRLDSYGDSLTRELGQVVARTADERGWSLRGPVVVRLATSDDVRYGVYQLAARVEEVSGEIDVPAAASSTDTVAVGVTDASRRPRARHQVRIVSGGASGETVPLTSERVVAGRLPECDITLDDPTVSREHAAFVRRGSEWWVVDLGSTNGTRVNGVTAAEHPVEPGDRVEFGEAVLEFATSPTTEGQ